MAAPLHNPLRSLIGYQLRRASTAAMEELARNLAALNMRVTEASVLLLVGANPNLRSIEVGRELGVQRANMTPLVNALERRGLLLREPVDGRSYRLSLTPAGEALRSRALQLMHAHDARLLQRVGAMGAEHLTATLQHVWTASGETTNADEGEVVEIEVSPPPSSAQNLYFAEK